MMGFYGGYGLLGGLGMGFGMIVWVLLIALVVWVLVRGLGGFGGTEPESPLELLKRRYARGEISQAEFEQARRDLS
ncbi:MAG: SHOCT domain-containing protein [Chloroflexi bacterium]|nr:SHOCT domain-containing protein [Bacteroidota bacterium]MCL5111103.1 SHOCT domain-containing protein [Chloroflexota bacterium]